MQRLIKTGLFALVATVGCKNATRDDSNVSAQKPVETQQESQSVLEGAKQAQDQGAGSYSSEPSTESRFSWLKTGTWNSAPSGETPAASAEASETTEPQTEVTRTVENTAALTVIQDAMAKSVSKTELVVTSHDDNSFHMVKAKLSPDTQITRNGDAASLSDIKAGDHVTVTYKMDHNQPIATSIDIKGAEQP